MTVLVAVSPGLYTYRVNGALVFDGTDTAQVVPNESDVVVVSEVPLRLAE